MAQLIVLDMLPVMSAFSASHDDLQKVHNRHRLLSLPL